MESKTRKWKMREYTKEIVFSHNGRVDWQKEYNSSFRQCSGLSRGHWTGFPSVLVWKTIVLGSWTSRPSATLGLFFALSRKGCCPHWTILSCPPLPKQHLVECHKQKHTTLLGFILSILCTLTHLILTAMVLGRYYYYLYFIFKKKLKWRQNTLQLVSGRFLVQTAWLQRWSPFSSVKTAIHLYICSLNIFWSPTHGASTMGMEQRAIRVSVTMELMFLVKGNRQ